MNGFDYYKAYLGIKQHFKNDQYDFFKYKGKVNATPESFGKRNDKYHFNKCVNKYSLDTFIKRCVANFFHDPDIWIKELHSKECDDRYREMILRQSSIQQLVSSDFKIILEMLKEDEKKFDDLFLTNQDEYAMILRLYFYDEISPETIIVMNEVLGFFSKFKKDYSEDIIVKKELKRLEKLSCFMSINKKSYKEILLQILKEKGFFEKTS